MVAELDNVQRIVGIGSFALYLPGKLALLSLHGGSQFGWFVGNNNCPALQLVQVDMPGYVPRYCTFDALGLVVNVQGAHHSLPGVAFCAGPAWAWGWVVAVLLLVLLMLVKGGPVARAGAVI